MSVVCYHRLFATSYLLRWGVELIDTHAHLACDSFLKDWDEVVYRAIEGGIKGIVCIICEFEEMALYLRIAEKYNTVYGAVGIHPHDAKDYDKNWKMLEEGLRLPRIKAVGEIGLDYYYKNSSPDRQRGVFQEQLQWAKLHKLPVIVHSREAIQDTMEIMKRFSPLEGVMHCFSGSQETMERFLDMGLFVSFAGPVTFPNAKNLDILVKSIPPERLLVETDSPYLAPQPKRGKRNEPGFLHYIIEEIANKRKEDTKVIERITEENARKLFKLI